MNTNNDRNTIPRRSFIKKAAGTMLLFGIGAAHMTYGSPRPNDASGNPRNGIIIDCGAAGGGGKCEKIKDAPCNVAEGGGVCDLYLAPAGGAALADCGNEAFYVKRTTDHINNTVCAKK